MSRRNISDRAWRRRASITGSVLGALVGLAAARVYVRRVEDSGRKPNVSVREVVLLASSVVALFRRIIHLGF